MDRVRYKSDRGRGLNTLYDTMPHIYSAVQWRERVVEVEVEDMKVVSFYDISYDMTQCYITYSTVRAYVSTCENA